MLSTTKGSTSCARCRKRRRGCRPSGPDAARWPCERCVAVGIECSGPAPDGRGIGPRRARGATLADARAAIQGEQAWSSSLLLTSMTWKIYTTTISQALYFHLVTVHLENPTPIPFQNSQSVARFEQKVGALKGHLTERSELEELAATLFALRGTRYSNHRALIGSLPVLPLLGFAGDDSTQDVKIGLSKISVQGPLLFRLLKLLDKLSRAMGDDVPLAVAKERLALCSEVLAGMVDLNEDFWALAGEVIKAGVGMLGREECGEEVGKEIRGYLAGVVIDKLIQSIPFHKASSVSPSTLDVVFKDHSSFFLNPLTPSDLFLIFTTSPETAPAYEALRQSSLPPIISLLVTIARVTSFHPSSSSSLDAFHKVQDLLAKGSDHFDSLFSDLSQLRRGAAGRKGDFLAHLFPAELILFRLAWNCVVLLSEGGGDGQRKAALRTAEETVERALKRCSDHVQVLMKYGTGSAQSDLALSVRLARALELVRGPFLVQWSRRFPLASRIFLKALRCAVHGCARAGFVVLELELAEAEPSVDERDEGSRLTRRDELISEATVCIALTDIVRGDEEGAV